MTTKTRRENQLRALARLAAQARLNVGDAQAHGRKSEEQAWLDALAWLQYGAALISSGQGLPVQLRLDGLL